MRAARRRAEEGRRAAPDPTDSQLDEFLEIRKPGAHLEEGVVADDFVLMLGVDLVNFPKFPRVDDGVTYPEGRPRHPPRARRRLRRRPRRLQRSVPRRPALHRLLAGGAGHEVPAVERGVPAVVRRRMGRGSGQALRRGRRGRDRVGRVERPDRARARAHAQRVPARRHRLHRPEPSRCAEADRATTRVVYTGLFCPRPDAIDLSKEQLVTWFLGTPRVPAAVHRGVGRADRRAPRARHHVRHPVPALGRRRSPGVKKLKAEYLGISGNTVDDWMKDLQLDATSIPGKAFDLSFEMPEPEVGIMTFNRCVAVDQWEGMGRPDILEKNCHSTCPKSMIVTTKMYNPNMKVDILAIPPRVDPGNVCCKWRFSMRDENDPEYVPIELGEKPVDEEA